MAMYVKFHLKGEFNMKKKDEENKAKIYNIRLYLILNFGGIK